MELFKTKYSSLAIPLILCWLATTACDPGTQVQPTDLENHLTTQIIPSVPIRNCEQPADPKLKPANHIVCRNLIKQK